MWIVEDGVEAMDFLYRRDRYADAPRPDLILLDLNLPRKDGRQVLAEIKDDASLRKIPVVVLTTSQAEEDVLKAYDLHANCYISKPVDFTRFMEVVRAIEGFWLTVVKLPHRPDRPVIAREWEWESRIMGNGVFRILLVEDNEVEATLLAEILKDTGEPFEVTHAETMAEAQKAARAGFDAVLLDLSLPDSRGLDTLERHAPGRSTCPDRRADRTG